MGKDSNAMPMAIHTLVILDKERLTEKESTHGKMVKYSMESGIKVLSTDMVFGREFMVILSLENGFDLKLMVMVCILGQTVIAMKVNGIWV